VIHLYAFARGLRALPQLGGVGHRPLEPHTIGDVVAIVSSIAEADVSQAAVVQHGLVVEALVEHADSVLPVRFGERFSCSHALVAAASERLDDLNRQLERLAGCVEIGVRVVRRRVESATAAVDGAGYMRLKLSALAESDALVAELHTPLLRNTRDTVVSIAPGTEVLHNASYLLSREEVPAFRELVEDYASAYPQLTVVSTGPWAPYSFTSAA
jgi:hypothetical protein